jgi:hypothetical protein
MVRGPAGDARDLAQMKSAGVTTVRIPISWASVQAAPRKSLRLAELDRLVGSISRRGIRVLPVIFGSPAWVESNGVLPPIDTKAKRAAWQHFLKVLVARYKPGGKFWTGSSPREPSAYVAAFGRSAPVRPITAWQIWNEPNLPKYFRPAKGAPKSYGKLLKLSHKAIAAADPKADVVLAGLSGAGKLTPWEFLEQLYRVKQIKPAFDAAALQPYPPTIKDLRSDLRLVRKAMKKGDDERTPLWITELGWGSKRRNPQWPLNKGKQGQKQMLDKSYELLIKAHESSRVDRVYWYTWRDPAAGENPGVCSFCTSSGLLQNDRTPKPAYDAFVRIARPH